MSTIDHVKKPDIIKRFHHGYVDCLLGADLDRYKNKITFLGGNDPYEIDISNTWKDVNKFPDVRHGDIHEYLVNTTHAWSMEQMRAFKATEAHNFFTSGWVQDVSGVNLSNGTIIIFGKVKHSYRLNEDDLKVWIAASEDGEIFCAHCTCVAGVSEACSHVGALLFCLEQASLMKSWSSCTSLANAWLPPKLKDVPCTEMKDISFKSAKQRYKEMQIRFFPSRPELPKPPKKKIKVIETTDAEREKFIKDSVADNETSVIMYVLPESCHLYSTKKRKETFRNCSLSKLFDKNNCSMSLEELRDKALTIFPELTVSATEIQEIEEKTRKQSGCSLWNDMRTGRTTASVMKAAIRTDVNDPSITLIKKNCYRNASKFFSPYTDWGIKNEEKVRDSYISQNKNAHKNFLFKKCGFRIHEKYPFIGASPDGIVKCDCHGTRLLEIKTVCPFVLKKKKDKENNENDKDIDDTIEKKKELKEEYARKIGKSLPENHDYYYQVQTQMMVWDISSCVFLVWHPKTGVLSQEITANKAFQNEMVEKAKVFFLRIILPELLSKYFSSLKHTALGELNYEPTLICLCQRPAAHPVIKCDNENCKTKIFHWKCVGVKGKRKAWRCGNCPKI